MNKGQFCFTCDCTVRQCRCIVSNSWHIHVTYNNNVRCQYNDNCCLCGMYRLPPVDGMLVHRSLPLLTGTLPSISFKKNSKTVTTRSPVGTPIQKRRGYSSEIFKRIPKRSVSRSYFVSEVPKVFFNPKRHQFYIKSWTECLFFYWQVVNEFPV